MIRKIYFFLTLFMCVNLSIAQVATIGNGTEEDDIPIALYYNYSYSQSIYLASEIGASGNIYRIKYKGKPGLSLNNSQDWVVYIGHTTNTEFTPNNWIPTTAMTEVFNGTVNVVDNNVEITLTTPFNYNGTDNLVIAVDENTDGYAGSSYEFYATNLTAPRSVLYRNDNTNPDPTDIASLNTISQNSVPNIDIDFNQMPCTLPSNVVVSNVMSTTADVNWTLGNTESSWDVQYGTSGFAIGSGTTMSPNATNTSLSSLMPATDYDVYVRANCGSGLSAWVGPVTFTTACETVTAMPFTEDFEEITTGQPNCWSVAGTTTNTNYHWSSTASGYQGRGLRFNSAFNPNGNTSELNTPILDITSLTTPQLTFYFQNASGGNFEVLVSADAGGNFTSLESGLTGVSEWTAKSYDLTAYKDSDVVIQFKGTSNYDFSSYIYLDSVVVQETPTCATPTNLTVADIQATSANLGWTANSGESEWEVEYGETGFTQGSGTTVTANANPFALTGLTAQTTYQYYVRANCGSEFSSWFGPLEFTTPCTAYTIPYNEGFETGYDHNTALAGCLTQESVSGSNDWTANETLTSYNRSPRTGDWNAFLRYSNDDWFFIPIDLLANQSYTVTVYAHQNSATAANVNLSISYGTAANAAAMTNEIVPATGIVDGDYQKVSGNFTLSTAGVYYVGIKGYLNSSPWYLSIDDISIDVSPNCLEPTDLTVSNLADVSATLGWTAGNATNQSWDVEYGADGFTQGMGTTVANIATNSQAITGLTGATAYEFYVRANCGDGDYSTWSGPFDFTTICSEFTAPYTQNFDGTTIPNLDACWSADVVGATSTFSSVETTVFNEVSEPNSVRFSNSSDNDGSYYLISPKFSDLDNTKRIGFQIYKNIGDDADGDVVEVGVLTDASDYNTYTTIYTFNLSEFTEDAWKQIYTNFDAYSGGAAHVVIKYMPGTGDFNSFYIDDFVYELIPTQVPDCVANSMAVLNDVNCGNFGALLSWDAVATAEGYKLTIGTSAGGNDILDAEDINGALTYTLDTMAETTYYWTVVPYNVVGDAMGCLEQTLVTPEGCYCSPSSTSSSTYIDSFVTTNGGTNIDNSNSGYTTSGYDDNFDTMSLTSAADSSFDFTLTLVGGTVGAAIWVDWNNDLTFDVTTEKVYETTGYVGGPITASVSIPSGTADGDYRMRVLIDYNDSTPGDNACAFNNTRGEAEDYKLVVDNALGLVTASVVDFNYYPNPVRDILTITSQDVLQHISVYNIMGQEVIAVAVDTTKTQLDMSQLNAGIYLVKVSNGTASKTLRVVKQ